MSYTVKEIADFLQVSKPTVRKYLNKLSDADRSGNSKDADTGALIISDHCYNALIELYRAENKAETLSGKFPETLGNIGGNTGNDFPETQAEIFRKQAETLENTVEDLRKQVERQEQHIEKL